MAPVDDKVYESAHLVLDSILEFAGPESHAIVPCEVLRDLAGALGREDALKALSAPEEASGGQSEYQAAVLVPPEG